MIAVSSLGSLSDESRDQLQSMFDDTRRRKFDFRIGKNLTRYNRNSNLLCKMKGREIGDL